MTLSLEQQSQLAMSNGEFRLRVTAACFNAAKAMYLGQPSSDATVQAQRLALVNLMLKDPHGYTELFSWIAVSASNVNSPDDLTDAFLIQVIKDVFDPVAALEVPVTP